MTDQEISAPTRGRFVSKHPARPEQLDLDADLDRAATTGDPQARPQVSIVVPTRNEAGNIAELLRQLDLSLDGLAAEVLFVDDSDDETPALIAAQAKLPGRRVRLLHRGPADRAGGLGGAVVAGFRAARAPVAIVMDGDLQHPPRTVPDLLSATTQDIDLAVASRYSGGGDAEGLSNRWRVAVSAICTLLARMFFPLRLHAIADPMSGFFAVRLAAVDLEALRPAGYKILLEIIGRSRPMRVVQVPFTFQSRLSGRSKASLREGGRLAAQLLRLRLAATAGSLGRATGFLTVGLSGAVVNTAALSLFTRGSHLQYLWASAAATQIAIGWNFVWLDRWVFAHPGDAPAAGRWRRFARFWLLNIGLLPVQLGLMALLVTGWRMSAELANVLVLGVVFVARYLVSSRWVYRPARRSGPAAADQQPSCPASTPEPAAARAVASRRVVWTGRAMLLVTAATIAVVRPGAWIPFVAGLLAIGLAHSAGWQGRQLRIIVLAVAVFVSTLDYLSWRLSVLSWSAWWIGVPLFLAELHAGIHSAGLHATLWPQRIRPLRPERDPSRLPVFVLIPTVDEGPEILEPTLRAALRASERYLQAHPHAQVSIVVCNDGGVAGAACSAAVEELAATVGVACITREIGGGAKAGNIENARQVLGATGLSLLVIFDADQIAHPDFLLATIPPFADPAVGWVQTGQYYSNRDNPVARWADDQQSLFYRLLCPGKADHDSAFICGTNVVLASAALDEIGGLPTDSVTEDFAASILLAPRWRSVYLPQVLATGLGPVDLRSYLRQQERWARGTLTVLRRHWRDLVLPARGGLRAQQRFQYALAVTHYLAGIRDLIFLVAPLLYLITGASGVRGATLGDFLYHFVPYYLLSVVGFWHAAWRVTTWRAIVIGFGSFPALLRAAWMTLVGRHGRFTITPKTRTSSSPWRTAGPHLIFLTACLLTLVVAATVHRSPAHWLSAGWLVYTCVILTAHLSLVTADRRAARATSSPPQPVHHLDRSPSGRSAPRTGPVAVAMAMAGGAGAGGRLRRLLTAGAPRHRFALGAALTVALVVAGVPELGLAPSSAAPVASPPTARGTSQTLVGFSGVDATQAATAGSEVGAEPTVEGWAQELADQFDASRATRLHAAGITPWLTLVLSTRGQSTLNSSLTAISNGVDDAALARWAGEIAAYAGPVYLTVLPAVDRNYAATSAVTRGGIPQDVTPAWEHLRGVFRAAGAANVAWVWSPADPTSDRRLAPPSRDVDLVAVTLYEYPGTHWVDPATRLAAVEALHPGKPLVVDVGAAGPRTARTGWLTALGRAVAGRRDVAVLTYHPAGPYTDAGAPGSAAWRIDADPATGPTLQGVFDAVQRRSS
jgi:cellulose synthase/poly-beta-1,6-N-acetylglucosamine synthase-like glycosyltransferase/putative flippase GtrA